MHIASNKTNIKPKYNQATLVNYYQEERNVVSVPLLCISAPNVALGMAAPTAETHLGTTPAKNQITNTRSCWDVEPRADVWHTTVYRLLELA